MDELTERIAQITAHRACCGGEHKPEEGKIHGFCIVCGVPFPCEYVGEPSKVIAELKAERNAFQTQAGARKKENFLLKVELTDCQKHCLEVVKELKAENERLKKVVERLPSTVNEIEQMALGDFSRSYTNSQVIAYQRGVEKLAKALHQRIWSHNEKNSGN